MRAHFVAVLFFAYLNAATAGQPPEPEQQKGSGLTDENVKNLWSNLADVDAAKAYRALCALTKTPTEAVAYIASRLESAVGPDRLQVERWIEDLNSESFAVRDKANLELTKLGSLVEAALHRTLKANPSLETRRRIEKLLNQLLGPITLPDQLRAVRAVETLETIGTTEAKTLIAKYAAGAPGARLTVDAVQALERMGRITSPHVLSIPSRTDLYGDPLPRGAVGRLGTLRFRWSSEGSFGPQGMAFLPDGKGLVTGEDRAVQVFEVPSGKLLHEIRTPIRIRRFVLAPDGQQFAVSGHARSSEGQLEFSGIQVCALPSGKLTRAFPRKPGDVSMAFSPDSKLLFSLSGREGVVKVEEIASGNEVAQRKFPSEDSADLAVSTDGKYLAINSGVNTRKLFLWKWQDEEPRQLDPMLQGRGLGSVKFSPDGKLLAGLQDFFSVYVWEVPSGRLLWQQQCPEKGFMFLGDAAFTSDGKTLAVTIRQNGSTSRGKIQLLDPATGRSQGLLDSTTLGRRLALSADARLLALAGGAGVRLWELPSRQELTAKIDAHQSYPSQIIVSPKGFLATACDDNTVRIWDAATSKQRQKFVADDWVRAVALSPDGTLLAASSMDDAVRVWDTSTSREVHRLKGHGGVGGRRTLGFFPDGQRLLSWGDDYILRQWDMKTGKASFEHPIRPDSVQLPDKLSLAGAAISPDGNSLVLDSGDHIHTFDTVTGKETLKFAKEGRSRTDMAFAPNGKTLLASAWGDNQLGKHPVSLTDLSSGTIFQQLLLPGSVGGPVAFSAHGRMFATSLEEPRREILVFETASGKVRYTIRGLNGRVWSLAFFPDGRRLASGLSDSTVMIWDLRAPEQMEKRKTSGNSS